MYTFAVRTGMSLALASLLLAACGGGGGGGGPGDGITTPAPPSPPPPPPPPPPLSPTSPASAPPDATSAEYKRNWGLGAVGAATPFNQGATGKGVTVAVIDTGVDLAQADMQGRFSPKSVDISATRDALNGPERHGTQVAGIIAANHNGMGTIGVAYEATILGIRADNGTATSCPGEDGCQFSDYSLVRAVDYAVQNGAHVINLSLGGDTPQSSSFEAALARAKNAGVIVVASSGNDGLPSPGWPGRYASDPRFAGYVIAVGATSQNGAMASFSNRAGVSASGYIAAPGDGVVTDCDGVSCWRVSGTSFSSPQVAGALALLLHAFPNLSGREAAEILLKTATDRGAAGTDSTWGRGVMDLTKAFAPVGSLSVQTPQGETVVSGGDTVGAATGLAFGDAILISHALSTVGRDDYKRLFRIDLAEKLLTGQGGLIGVTPATRSTATAVQAGKDARLSLAAEAPYHPDEQLPEPMLNFVRGEAPQSVTARADIGRLSFGAWAGKGGVAPPATPGGRDVFRAVAAPNQTVSAAYTAADWTFSAEQGEGERRELLTGRAVDGPSYVSATALWRRGDVAAALTAGEMEEPQGPLGSDIMSTSPLAMPASTRFTALSLQRDLRGLSLRAEAGVGRTSLAGGLFRLDDALSSQWRVSAYGACRLGGCSRFGLELEQPLRLEDGEFSALLADVPAEYFDETTFSMRRWDASPSGRQLNLRGVWERDLEQWGALRLRGVAAVNSGHREDGGFDLGGAVDWRVRF
ncbi:MAG TPA: S8 family peptidase [Caulobacteraceae bacterium]|nr:S8 family peptidase [Caulobacteraceae bacterium]